MVMVEKIVRKTNGRTNGQRETDRRRETQRERQQFHFHPMTFTFNYFYCLKKVQIMTEE
ncbi:hypothetical protein ACF0H5_004052 [Mactra antiquata]